MFWFTRYTSGFFRLECIFYGQKAEGKKTEGGREMKPVCEHGESFLEGDI
jgi:hypothetical protein